MHISYRLLALEQQVAEQEDLINELYAEVERLRKKAEDEYMIRCGAEDQIAALKQEIAKTDPEAFKIPRVAQWG